jgi:ribosomal protein S7
VFKNKQKRVICKLSKDRVERLMLLNIFFQSLISRGKRKLSLGIFRKLLLLLKFKYRKNFIESYLQFLEKVRPLICYKVMFIGGKKYKIPTLMPLSKSYSTSIRWLIDNSDKRDVASSLFNHINISLKNEGALIKYRKEYHSASFENKSYIRFLRFLKTGF